MNEEKNKREREYEALDLRAKRGRERTSQSFGRPVGPFVGSAGQSVDSTRRLVGRSVEQMSRPRTCIIRCRYRRLSVSKLKRPATFQCPCPAQRASGNKHLFDHPPAILSSFVVSAISRHKQRQR